MSVVEIVLVVVLVAFVIVMSAVIANSGENLLLDTGKLALWSAAVPVLALLGDASVVNAAIGFAVIYGGFLVFLIPAMIIQLLSRRRRFS